MVNADVSWNARVLVAGAAYAARQGSRRDTGAVSALARTVRDRRTRTRRRMALEVARSPVWHERVVDTVFVRPRVSAPGGGGETGALVRPGATV